MKARLPQLVRGKAIELIVPATVEFSNCEGCDCRVSLLPDDGCEAFALAQFDFFSAGTLIPAPCDPKIVTIEGSNIRGGTEGGLMIITVPARNSSGLEGLTQCQRAFVYAAQVCGGLVAGYPFSKAYALCVYPVADCLRDCPSHSLSTSSASSELVEDTPNKQGDVQCACISHSALHPVSRSDPGVLLDDVLQLSISGRRLGNHCICAHSVHFACGHALFVYEPILFACTLAWRS